MIESIAFLLMGALFIGPLVAFFLKFSQKYYELRGKTQELEVNLGLLRSKMKKIKDTSDYQLQEIREELHNAREWEKKMKEAEDERMAYLDKVTL